MAEEAARKSMRAMVTVFMGFAKVISKSGRRAP
jgi:hypothetical protein